MADISEDSALLVDFSAGKDIHKATAARLLNKRIEKVTASERAMAKTVNFSILFGQTPYGLSRLLGIESKAATEYIDEYFRQYKGVKEYIEKAKETALENGYVQTMLGRTRYITGLSSRNFNVKNAAVREAINMPIQGGEADIMKLAMIELDKMIEKKYMGKAFTLLQIHDELVFEVEEGSVKSFEKDTAKIMKRVVELKVPLDVNTGVGDNLSELK
jgi:DNA polymerase-1